MGLTDNLDWRTDLNDFEDLENVFVEHPDAACGSCGSYCPGFVGAVDSVDAPRDI